VRCESDTCRGGSDSWPGSCCQANRRTADNLPSNEAARVERTYCRHELESGLGERSRVEIRPNLNDLPVANSMPLSNRCVRHRRIEDEAAFSPSDTVAWCSTSVTIR
jgi:hypothetical protein